MNAKPKRWGWGAGVLAVLPAVVLLVSSCEKPVPTDPEKPDEPAGPPFFEVVTKATGIDHSYRNGEEAGHLAILESLGGGAALIDYDRDGLLDVFLTGGGHYAGADKKDIKGLPAKLYRNKGGLMFEDVTKEAGLDMPVYYTHGAAVADYDRDGWSDLLVTGWGRLVLYHNEADGKGGRRFADVTQKAGLTDDSWSTSAGWADLDGDGHVDLYVCHYVDWSFAKHPSCSYDGKTADVCPPKNFSPLPHILYRNNGDRTFADVSKPAGLRVPRSDVDFESLKKDYAEEALASGRARAVILARFTREELDALKKEKGLEGKPPDREAEHKLEKEARERAEKRVEALAPAEFAKEADKLAEDACARLRAADDPKEKEKAYGKGLGVLLVDVNADGRPDVYVANDTVDNFLYVNRSKPGRILLEEVGLGAGVARDDRGSPNGSMGVDAGDPLGTGRPAIWVSNYENEMHALYLNECAGEKVIFRYGTQMTGIAAIGQAFVGWGTQFVDFDLDGWEDLFVSNGHAIRFPTGKAKRAQRPVLLHNELDDKERHRFRDISRQIGDYFGSDRVGRGVAFGDLDNDGHTDLVLANINEPAEVLRGVAGEGHHWLGLDLRRKENRDPVGARVALEADGRTQTRFAKGGGSYMSANDTRLVFGLGKGEKVGRVTVTWPDGKLQTWEGLTADRYWRLTEGEKEAK
jgi:hypothetical protein